MGRSQTPSSQHRQAANEIQPLLNKENRVPAAKQLGCRTMNHALVRMKETHGDLPLTFRSLARGYQAIIIFENEYTESYYSRGSWTQPNPRHDSKPIRAQRRGGIASHKLRHPNVAVARERDRNGRTPR